MTTFRPARPLHHRSLTPLLLLAALLFSLLALGPSDTATAQQSVLDAPTDFRATPGNGSARLEWTGPSGGDVAGYYVARGTDPDALSLAFSTSSVRSTLVFGLANGTTYYVQVMAHDSNSELGNPSALLRVTPQANASDHGHPSPLSAPALTEGDGFLDVAWSAPDSDGGNSVFRYNLRYRKTGDARWSRANGAWTLERDAGAPLRYRIEDLDNLDEYEVQVKAITSSPAQRNVSFSPSAYGIPARIARQVSGQAGTAQTVPPDWALIPEDSNGNKLFTPGQSFRLLFVTSTTRDATSTDIADYNSFVQTAAAAGHAAIQDFDEEFRAVGCTSAVDAKTNTGTAATGGEPIYWLDGDKAADDYADFYDDSWDSTAGKTQSGGDSTPREVWTGCEADGDADTDALGTSGFVRVGSLAAGGDPIDDENRLARGAMNPLYALSPVLTVGAYPFCVRTAVVRDAILAAHNGGSGNTQRDCDNGDNDDSNAPNAMELAAVTTLDLSNQSISALASGDFGGLTGLTSLDLTDNSALTTLPNGILDPALPTLTTLSLDDALKSVVSWEDINPTGVVGEQGRYNVIRTQPWAAITLDVELDGFGLVTAEDLAFPPGTASVEALILDFINASGDGATYSIKDLKLTLNTALTASVVAFDADRDTLTSNVVTNSVPDFGTRTVPDQSYTQGAAITSLVLPEVASGGNGAITYTLSGLPTGTGLAFAAATRTLSGTPNAADQAASPFTLTYTAADGDGNTSATDEDELTFDVTVAAPDTAPDFGTRTVSNQSYTQGTTITDLALPEVASGGNGAITYTLSGLPTGTGLSFAAATRTLSGTPSAADQGASPITLTYTAADADTNTAATDEDELTFDVTVLGLGNKPAAPAAPTLTPGHHTIAVAWVAPADGGSPITEYDFEREPVPNPDGSVTSYTETNPALRTFTSGSDRHPLTPGDAYRVRVRAVNANGDGPWSPWTSATLPADNTAPMLSTAAVNGAELVLTYDEPIHITGTPPASAYTVTAAGSPVTVSTVDVTRDWTVTLTLASAVTPTQTVTVSYAVPTPTATTFPVQDYAQNLVAALTNQAVTNNTPAADTAPDFGTRTVPDQSYTQGAAITSLVLPEVASGGDGAITYTLSGLPSNTGLSFTAATRTLSGTPSAADQTASPFTLTYTAADADANTAATDEDELTFEVTVAADAVPTDAVPADWALIPSGIQAGDSFRLLFVTSTSRNATSANIATYNTFVQNRANSGHAAIRQFKDEFRAVGCTSAVNAKTNTGTSATGGEPIYWLDGAKAADNYADFYDGSWDSRAGRNESGAGRSPSVIWTGCASNGNAHTRALGTSGSVRVGSLTTGGTLSASNILRNARHPLYALSPVLTVAAADTTAPTLSTATVNGAALTLTYDEALDTASAPAASAFTVTVGSPSLQVQVTVSGVSVAGNAVTLTLASPVTRGQTVRVSYAVPTSNPIRNLVMLNAPALTNQAVTNNTGLPAAMAAPTLTPGQYIIEVAWVAPSNDGGSRITLYDIEANPTSDTSIVFSQFRFAPALMSDDIGGYHLTPNTEYRVRVRAVNANGNGPWSPYTTATTTADTTNPTLTSATVNGATLQIVYDDGMDGGSVPAPSTFSVNLGSTTVTPSSVRIIHRVVILTLPSAATRGQTVEVSYTRGADPNPVRNLAGRNAANLSFQAVTNNTPPPDTTAPVLSTATVNGATLTLTYNEALDESSVPAPAAFTVLTDAGSPVTVSAVSVAGSTVTLTLAPPVTGGQAVGMSYAVPGTNPIQDAAGNAAAALTNRMVTNFTGSPTAPAAPTFGAVTETSFVVNWAAPSSDGGSPITRYDLERQGGATEPAFEVSQPDPALTSYLWERYTIAPATAYEVRVRAVNANGNGPWSEYATVTTAADTPPTLSAAAVNGATLTLTYDEHLDTSSRPAASAFTVTAAGSPVTVSGVSFAGAARNTRSVTLTLGTAVPAAQTVTVSYAVPGTNPIQDNTGNAAGALTNQAVTNNTPAIAIAYTGSFTEAAANDGSVTGSVIATLALDTFTAGVARGTGVNVTNLPSGLSARYALDSGRTALTLTLTGRAASHADSDDVANLTVTFAAAAFTSSTASQVANSTKSDLSIDFNDADIAWAGGFTERSANDGSVTGSVTATLSGDTFTAGVRSGTGVSVTNLPAGLTARYALNSRRTVFTLTLTGRAANHADSDDVSNLLVTFADAAFTSSTASQVTNSTRADLAIDFNDLPPAAPGAPTGLTLTAGEGQITAAWTAPADPGYPATLTGYEVQYRTSGSWQTWTRTAQNPTDTAETITGLTNNRTYYVRVAAINDTGTGRYTSARSARPVEDPGVPGAVTGLTLTPGEGRIRATWTAPTDMGNPRLNGYSVQYRASGAWQDWTHRGTGRSATITGLTNGTTYQVRVAAVNTTGTGGYAAESARPAGRPTVPLNLSLRAGNEMIEATWDPPANDGGSPLTRYRVQYRTSGGWTTWTPDPGLNDHVDRTVAIIGGLTNGRTYYVRVAAENPTGISPYTAAVRATLDVPREMPSAPRNLRLSAGDAQIEVSWNPPFKLGRPGMTRYKLEYRAGSGSWRSWRHSASGEDLLPTQRATITGLTNGTAYSVRVAAVNSVGTGLYAEGSATPTAPTPAPEPTPTPEPVSAPEAPDAPSVAQTGSGGNADGAWVEVRVSWNAVENAQGYKLHYRSERSDSAGVYWTDWFEIETGGRTFVNMRVFDNTTSMQFKVKAVNAGGDGPFSGTATFNYPSP